MTAMVDPVLDRSTAQLRLPMSAADDVLRLALELSLAGNDDRLVAASSGDVGQSLVEAGILDDSGLDPVAAELLDVVNTASLIITVDLTYGDDASTSTIWATPRRAVASSSVDPEAIHYRHVPITQLPQVLAELVVLRSPQFVGDVPISINGPILAKVDVDDTDDAIEQLTSGGLDGDQAVIMLDLQRPNVRRWHMRSTWSTETGPESTELRGLDAGPSGQWLIASTAPEMERGQLTFTPQGHGEVMSAFRSVLPRNWLGRPLNPPPSEEQP
jgi:hypothetical protein